MNTKEQYRYCGPCIPEIKERGKIRMDVPSLFAFCDRCGKWRMSSIYKYVEPPAYPRSVKIPATIAAYFTLFK